MAPSIATLLFHQKSSRLSSPPNPKAHTLTNPSAITSPFNASFNSPLFLQNWGWASTRTSLTYWRTVLQYASYEETSPPVVIPGGVVRRPLLLGGYAANLKPGRDDGAVLRDCARTHHGFPRG